MFNREMPEYIKSMSMPMIFVYLKNRVMQKLRIGMFSQHSNYWNERLVEIPCILNIIETIKLIKPKAKILEVGNVLHQSTNTTWDIIDKIELGTDLFDEKRKFDVIISISTLEHIGYKGILKCQSLLKKDGIFICTIPIGYNKKMDAEIESNMPFDSVLYLERKGVEHWELVKKIPKVAFHYPYDCANALLIAFFKKK